MHDVSGLSVVLRLSVILCHCHAAVWVMHERNRCHVSSGFKAGGSMQPCPLWDLYVFCSLIHQSKIYNSHAPCCTVHYKDSSELIRQSSSSEFIVWQLVRLKLLCKCSHRFEYDHQASEGCSSVIWSPNKIWGLVCIAMNLFPIYQLSLQFILKYLSRVLAFTLDASDTACVLPLITSRIHCTNPGPG